MAADFNILNSRKIFIVKPKIFTEFSKYVNQLNAEDKWG
jgi:hypothetical protein